MPPQLLDTGHRKVEHPVDGLGRVRWRAELGSRAITRAASESDPIGFKGHAAVFGKRAWIGGKQWGWWEEVAADAFAKTLKEADVRFLINHDPNLILARNKAGTLRLAEDKVGLAVDADMAPTTYGRDLAISLERGDITQMSFAFDVIGYRVGEAEDGKELVTLTELRLYDVAAVTYPAYAETDASLRSAAFGEICDRLQLTAADVLAQYDARGAINLDELRAPAETTRSGPPAETTGVNTPTNPHRRVRELRARELAKYFQEN